MLKQQSLENSFFLNWLLSGGIAAKLWKENLGMPSVCIIYLKSHHTEKNTKNPTPQMSMPTYAEEYVTANK